MDQVCYILQTLAHSLLSERYRMDKIGMLLGHIFLDHITQVFLQREPLPISMHDNARNNEIRVMPASSKYAKRVTCYPSSVASRAGPSFGGDGQSCPGHCRGA